MMPIDSPRDLEAALAADRAMVFIFFAWSARSVQSQKLLGHWQLRNTERDVPVYQLSPDSHSFSWRWLDTILGNTPEAERAAGALVWLRQGSVAAFVSDAARAGEKLLERVTHDCFVLNQTHSAESIASLQNEPAPFDTDLLKILCCPETHQPLALADAAMLDKLNQRLATGALRNRAGEAIQEKIEDGLVRADGRYLYPMRRNIPVLLVDEAIPLA